jgi:methyltransferase-like protein
MRTEEHNCTQTGSQPGPVARAEAALGQPWVTSLHHTGVPALPILKLLLPILDGMHDRAALREAVISALQAGAIPMPAGETSLSRESVAEVAEQCLAQSLAYLSRRALLQPT